MEYEFDEKTKTLLKMATDAVKNQDWKQISKVGHYNAEMGNFMLKAYGDQLPLETKCEIAMYHYSNHGDFYPTIRKYARKARVIRPENWREELPSSVRDLDRFTVYRGGGEDISRAAYYMSWTLSQEMAEWFMKRHELTHPGEQHLYRGTISADKVIAYIGGRFEFEIVQYRGVKNIEEIPLAGISAGFEEMRNSGDIHHPADMKVAQDYFDKMVQKDNTINENPNPPAMLGRTE